MPPEIIAVIALALVLVVMASVLHIAEKQQTEAQKAKQKENNRPRILHPNGHPIRP